MSTYVPCIIGPICHTPWLVGDVLVIVDVEDLPHGSSFQASRAVRMHQ